MTDPLIDYANGANNRPKVTPPVGFKILDTGLVSEGDLAWNNDESKWEKVPVTKVVTGYAVKDFYAVCRTKKN